MREEMLGTIAYAMAALPAPVVERPRPPAPGVGSLQLRAIDDSQWLAFLQTQADATAFHHPAWSRLIADAYGYRPMAAVLVESGGGIVAGLPVMATRRLSQRQLIALPYTDHCPPLSRGRGDATDLASALVRWSKGFEAAGLDIHGELPAVDGTYPVQAGVRHVLELSGEPSFESRLKGSPVLRGVRKAQREGVVVSLTRSVDELDTFYRLHWHTRHRLGVPVQPRRFFEALWREVLDRGLGFVVVARLAGRPIATALYLGWNRTLIYKYGASDARYWQLRPNNLVMWMAIEWALGNSYRRVDFGRSDIEDRGLRDYKSRWGAVETSLVYTHIGSRPPVASRGLAMRLARPVIRWSPLFVCRGIGELLYGRLGGNL